MQHTFGKTTTVAALDIGSSKVSCIIARVLKDKKINVIGYGYNAARGIKKVEQMGGKDATKNMNMKDIVKAGEEKLSDIELAEMILEKSGQDVKKRKNNLKKTKDNIELKHFAQPAQNNKKAFSDKKSSNFGR